MYTPEGEPGWITVSFDILAEYICLQYPEMAEKLYSPVYSPGQTAKKPKKIYDMQGFQLSYCISAPSSQHSRLAS